MLQKCIDGQYRRPSGIVGWWIGRLMVEQHRTENLWTVDLLDVQLSDHILEVGFGAGFAIQEIARRLTTGVIVGVDFSTTMLDAACRRNSRLMKLGRVDLRYGDATQLPFSENSFDKVFSIHSLYFWKDTLTGLNEIKRVLKLGGTIVLTFLPRDRWKGDTPSEPLRTPEFKVYSGDELKNLLLQVGFNNLRIETNSSVVNPSNYSIVGQKP
jgi:ubiquinone/menaquinone biosynthesis C-methylase UbiE